MIKDTAEVRLTCSHAVTTLSVKMKTMAVMNSVNQMESASICSHLRKVGRHGKHTNSGTQRQSTTHTTASAPTYPFICYIRMMGREKEEEKK